MTKAATVHVPDGMLLWGRERAHATVKDAAERCGHEDAVVESWEAGYTDPPLTALRELARMYGLPLAAFLLSKPKDEPQPPVDQRALAGVVSPRINARLALALNRATGLQVVASELQEALDAAPFTVVAGNVDPEWLAAQERATLRLDINDQFEWRDEDEALWMWRRAIERRGAFVLQMPLGGTDVRAFSLRADPPVIVINRSEWARAKLFSLAHEFGHVVVGGAGICIPGATNATGIEAWCNRFADALLVPADAFADDPNVKRIMADGEPTDHRVRAIAGRFKVSHAVVWYRLFQTKVITHETFSAGWENWSSWRPAVDDGGGGQPTAKNVVRDYGVAFPELLVRASRKGLMNDTDVSQYLSVQPHTIASIEAEVASRLTR
jgi:Zn-dependent peptidase ImmA (M78 family)